MSWTNCPNVLVAGVFVLMTSCSVVTSVPWRDCDPLGYTGGLNVLNCSGKDLFELPKISPVAEVLDFSKNRFTELPLIEEVANCVPHSKEGRCHVINSTNHCRYKISFSRNEINRFHEHAFHPLACLSTLDLSYNEITHEILHPRTFQEGLYNLQIFILRGNPLGILPDNVLPAPFMVDLRELDLSHCDLDEIGKDSIDDHSKLRILNLAYNKLTTIHSETFKGLFSLERLDLRENQLTYLPERVFGDLSALTTLLLSNNKIKAFHSDAFFSDSSLSFIDLTHNAFSRIPYEAVDKLPKLTTMNLSHNPMDTVASGSGISSVKTLILDNLTSLTRLGRGALASFPRLVNLSVSGCRRLTSIDPLVLGSAGGPDLKTIKLEHNALESLAIGTLPWAKMTSLKLSDNPWSCDARIAWMKQARNAIQQSPICDSPLKLHGQTLFELELRELGRYFSPSWVTGIVVFLVSLPLVLLFGFLIWKRKRFFVCIRTKIRGQYVSVFTRDMDGEDDHVDIELKVNVNRLKAVSNGAADDTKPFIAMEQETAKEDMDEEEI